MGGGGGVVGGAGADMPGDKAQLCKLIQQKLNVVFLFLFLFLSAWRARQFSRSLMSDLIVFLLLGWRVHAYTHSACVCAMC